MWMVSSMLRHRGSSRCRWVGVWLVGLAVATGSDLVMVASFWKCWSADLRRARRTRPDRMTWRGRDLVGAAGVGNDGDRVEGVGDREVGEVTSHPLPLKRLRVVPRRIERFFHWQGRSTAERARRGRHGMRFVGLAIFDRSAG
jgi:hypothetical protein